MHMTRSHGGMPRLCMGWLRLVGSLKLYVSFAKGPYQRDDILQTRPIILRSLLIVATPYQIGSTVVKTTQTTHPDLLASVGVLVLSSGRITHDQNWTLTSLVFGFKCLEFLTLGSSLQHTSVRSTCGLKRTCVHYVQICRVRSLSLMHSVRGHRHCDTSAEVSLRHFIATTLQLPLHIATPLQRGCYDTQ